MEDELFGNLKWDEGSYLKSGVMTTANGRTVKFTVDVDEDWSLTEATRDSMKFMIANETLMRRKVAAAMTELYAEWSDGKTITPNELALRIELKDISFLEEGGGELYYYPDGNMFGGHWICAWFDANGEIEEPSLEG
jgi:hypothetical protein